MCGSEKKTAGCISKNKGRNITAVAKVSHASVELHAWPFLVLYVVCCFVSEILCHIILTEIFIM